MNLRSTLLNALRYKTTKLKLILKSRDNFLAIESNVYNSSLKMKIQNINKAMHYHMAFTGNSINPYKYAEFFTSRSILSRGIIIARGSPIFFN